MVDARPPSPVAGFQPEVEVPNRNRKHRARDRGGHSLGAIVRSGSWALKRPLQIGKSRKTSLLIEREHISGHEVINHRGALSIVGKG